MPGSRNIERVPREVQKSYANQYASPATKRRGRRGHRQSLVPYDKHTDKDIFALGNAVKTGDLNLDDLLDSAANRSDLTIEKGEDGKTRIIQTQAVSPTDGTAIPMIDIDGDGIPDIPDPTLPQVEKKKILTIDDKKIDPDKLKELEKNLGEKAAGDKEKPKVVDPKAAKDSKTKELKRIPSCDDILSEEDILAVDGKRIKYAAIQIEEDYDEDGDSEEASEEDSEEEDSICCKICPCFGKCSSLKVCPCIGKCNSCKARCKRSKKGQHVRTESEKIKDEENIKCAKAGMVASEVDGPGEEAQMPAVKMMIMNYRRMLDQNMEDFRDALFRAVKLNGLDVVKLLCRLAMRKGVKLGSTEMREPESSATILHVALLYGHEAMVEHLIKMGDKDLLMAKYTRKEYQDQTALHVAVANGNLKLVDMLLKAVPKEDKKALMNTVATGSFFREEHPEGQLCLSAAAWSKNSDNLILLAKHGASFAQPNLTGNTLLHSIVLSSAGDTDQARYQKLIDKVFEAVGEWAKHCKYSTNIPAQRKLEQHQKQIKTFHKLLALPNDDGATPLILAAQIGSPLLVYLMNLEKIYKIPQTKLGSVAWVTYDVTDVSTFASGKYNKFSVLHVLAHNKGLGRHQEVENVENVLDVEPIKSLLAKKWSVYRKIYIAWCLFHLVYMSFFTYASLKCSKMWIPETSTNSTVPPSELERETERWMIIFVIFPSMYIISEFLDWFGSYPYSIQMMHNKSLLARLGKRTKTEWVITGNGPYRTVLLGFSVFSILWHILYHNHNDQQIMALSMALLLGWIFLLFFTRGCRVTSRFSIMIQKMFFRDLMYFMAVYLLIMIGFTFSVHALYINQSAFGLELKTSKLLYIMFNIVIELDEKGDMPPSTYPLFTKAMVIMYTVIAVVLLLNMLIAMMNTSYEAIRTTQSNIWKQQQLSIMLMLERRLFWIRSLCQYSESNVWHKQWGKIHKAYIEVSTTQQKTVDGGEFDEE